MYFELSQSKKFLPTGLPTEEEKKNELKIKENLEGRSTALSLQNNWLIRFNSTFIELTDTNYLSRGLSTFGYLFGILVILGNLMLISKLTGAWAFVTGLLDRVGWTALLLPILTQLILMAAIHGLLQESFSYTHLPIRFNRKNRKIYIWKRDGTVLTAEWDKVFFCISTYRSNDRDISEIRGHITEGKGKHVALKDIFRFGYVARDPNDLYKYWEYVRSYMEDGPEELHKTLKACLPIAERHETWREGFDSLPWNWFTKPFYFFVSFARVFAMRTSKIPCWPDWVERECWITKNDPYVRRSGYVEA